jgi:hypothetical protein
MINLECRKNKQEIKNEKGETKDSGRIETRKTKQRTMPIHGKITAE